MSYINSLTIIGLRKVYLQINCTTCAIKFCNFQKSAASELFNSRACEYSRDELKEEIISKLFSSNEFANKPLDQIKTILAQSKTYADVTVGKCIKAFYSNEVDAETQTEWNQDETQDFSTYNPENLEIYQLNKNIR